MNPAALKPIKMLLAALLVLLGAVSANRGQTPPQSQTATQSPGTQATPAAQVPGTQAQPNGAPAEPLQWKAYSYHDEGFSASFPAEPMIQKQSVPTEKGALELHNYTVERGPVAFYVGVCDYGEAVKGSDPDAVLEGARNGAVSNASAHLLRSKKLTLGIYPGIAFEAEADTMHLSARIYLVGSILYQTFVAGPLTERTDDTTKFLDSFQLIARTTE